MKTKKKADAESMSKSEFKAVEAQTMSERSGGDPCRPPPKGRWLGCRRKGLQELTDRTQPKRHNEGLVALNGVRNLALYRGKGEEASAGTRGLAFRQAHDKWGAQGGHPSP
jgi:hypothetical protein